MIAMPLKTTLIALLALPAVEIGLFVALAQQFGLWLTLVAVLLTSAMGAIVLRRAGGEIMGVLRTATNAAESGHSEPAAEAAFRTVAGALLLLPGFLTDAAGALLLLPPVQRIVRRRLARAVRGGQETKQDNTVVDLDPSEWRRHPE